MIKLFSSIFSVLLLLTVSCFSVTFVWDKSSDTNIVSYKFYYGISSGVYTNTTVINGVNTTTNVVPNSSLVGGIPYYFAVTAINNVGLESDFSNEVIYSVDAVLPNVVITYPPPGAILTNANITLTGTASDNVGVAQVLYQLNGGSFLIATGTNSWSVPIILILGTNTISVKSVDTTGNSSFLITETVVYSTKPSIPTGLKVILPKP